MAEQKHHYIPKFYLKQWAGADGRLIEYCRRHDDRVITRPTYPGGTGYLRGLYSIQGAPTNLADVFENKFLSIADGQAAESLRVMLNDNIVPIGSQKAAWTRFMMSLWYRTPEGVARALAKMREIYLEQLIEENRPKYADLRRPTDPPTIDEYMTIRADAIVSRTTIEHLLAIIQSERVGEKIMQMQWHLGSFKGGRFSLLTSDRPIVMTNGIGHKDSHLVMPLSP